MKIGFIGTGLMGLPMAQRLITAGHSVTAYNRTDAKLESLVGATIATSSSQAIVASDCVILMLTNAEAIEQTLLSDQAVLQGRTVIQMSTIAPDESQSIRDQVVAAGGSYLEAPVLGSIPEARSGKLIVMVGAEVEQFEQWRSLLQTLGENPVLLGTVGSASTVKLALNQLIGSLTSAFAVSLGLVLRQNVEVEAFMQILRQSALYAPTFDKKLQRMLDRDFENPNFPTKHLQKDINLFVEAARSANLNVASVEGVREILQSAIAQNLSDLDYAALFSIVCPVELQNDQSVEDLG
ncbi:NAD(P)-binding domain-containing protein [Leptolyngbya sp. FACHB-17]|uniref:NAD(P)-binding domain-containing protein n=1 Tax=unclassified Leptolyngbya TaxID=2650499 RepID=UPI00167FF0CD|nr:NAD(P)-dependent oxidoreductase [Leptolyngbya sp. FACHB-17]